MDSALFEAASSDRKESHDEKSASLRQGRLMRVVSHSDRELVLEHRPLVLPIVAGALTVAVAIQTFGSPASLGLGDGIGGSLGVLVGSFITYLTALPSRVVFNGTEREVRWTHRGWPGRERGSRLLDEVTGVRVDANPHGNGADERVALLTAEGPIPLTRHYSGFAPHERTATAIRTWLREQGCDLAES